MALTLFQEQIPFSNKKTDFPISSNERYTNPVIMSFAFDFTICTNFLETVLYIRNDDINKYYKNVVVTLCRKDLNVQTPAPVLGTVKETIDEGAHLLVGTGVGAAVRPRVPLTYSTETHATVPLTGFVFTNQYDSGAIPVTDYTYTDPISNAVVKVETDEHINIRFSHGYDELSNVEWANKKPGVIIPYIGTKAQADMSYIPIRMRMLWKTASSLFTIRDYFIDVSYQQEQVIGLD